MWRLGGLAVALGGLIAGALSASMWMDRHRDQRICDQCVHALPGILLAIAFVAFSAGVVQPGSGALHLRLVGYARLVRAQVMAVKEREFVEARARWGIGPARARPPHPAQHRAAADCAGGHWMAARCWRGTLSFLGLGVPPPTSSWESCSTTRAPTSSIRRTWLCFRPSRDAAVLSFNFIGDALRDFLDPRTR